MDSMKKSDLVAVRIAGPEDKNFILATFLRGLYYGDFFYSEIPKSTFMTYYHKVIEMIMSKSITKIACLKEDPSVIFGYAMMDSTETIIHFVFCKKAYRGIGIANQLVPSSVKTATHLTKCGRSISKKKGIIFNPFLL